LLNLFLDKFEAQDKDNQETIMAKNIHCDETPSFDQVNDVNWHEYYPRLLSLAKHFVYAYHIPCWDGQEEDIAEDVAQETMLRLIKRIYQSQQGMALPIHSLKSMATTIARNYVLDLGRHDRRVVRFSETVIMEVEAAMDELESPSEKATQQIFHEWVFLQVASEINGLPCKQRRAILMDLANRMNFDSQPTPLQLAFLALGISIQEYQRLPSKNSVERARHSSLLSLAYKRIARLSVIDNSYRAS
jgi:RNA polymerase sigma factor (sigma-70 family)